MSLSANPKQPSRVLRYNPNLQRQLQAEKAAASGSADAQEQPTDSEPTSDWMSLLSLILGVMSATQNNETAAACNVCLVRSLDRSWPLFLVLACSSGLMLRYKLCAWLALFAMMASSQSNSRAEQPGRPIAYRMRDSED
jgi:hypothetical protein